MRTEETEDEDEDEDEGEDDEEEETQTEDAKPRKPDTKRPAKNIITQNQPKKNTTETTEMDEDEKREQEEKRLEKEERKMLKTQADRVCVWFVSGTEFLSWYDSGELQNKLAQVLSLHVFEKVREKEGKRGRLERKQIKWIVVFVSGTEFLSWSDRGELPTKLAQVSGVAYGNDNGFVILFCGKRQRVGSGETKTWVGTGMD